MCFLKNLITRLPPTTMLLSLGHHRVGLSLSVIPPYVIYGVTKRLALAPCSSKH